MVKSQDIVVLVKLISIEKMIIKFNDLYQDEYNFYYLNDRSYDSQKFFDYQSISLLLSMRGLAESINISKSETAECIKRLYKIGLLTFKNQKNGERIELSNLNWEVNKRSFFKLIVNSFEFFFKTEPKAIDIGIPTVFSNELLKSHLAYSSPLPFIWPIASYKAISGIAVDPLHKSVPQASMNDQYLYEIFSLIDVFRIGSPREKKIAQNLLEEEFYL